MRDEVFSNKPVAKGITIFAGTIALIVFGLHCLLNPGRARDRYIRGFDLNSKLKWNQPSTYLRFMPPLVAFRAFGGLSIFCGLLLLFLYLATFW